VEGSKFRDLRAYRLARTLAHDINEVVLAWPPVHLWSIGMQLIRAADSIGANIAEATGRWHQGDQRRMLFVARGSLHETEHWIAVAQERGLLPADAGANLPELARLLNGLIRKRDPR
jgi:four helix bundle protein